jgi:hypothetical protein
MMGVVKDSKLVGTVFRKKLWGKLRPQQNGVSVKRTDSKLSVSSLVSGLEVVRGAKKHLLPSSQWYLFTEKNPKTGHHERWVLAKAR